MDHTHLQSTLRHFLGNLPASLHFKTNHNLQLNVFRALYYALGEDLLTRLFPENAHLFPESFSEVFTQTKLSSKTERANHNHAQFYRTLKEASFTHLGRPCGRKFAKGEPIYRCLECSFDETCVLCVHCFNKADHQDHLVSVQVAEDNNGICDCGDPEAFKQGLSCLCSSEVALEPLPELQHRLQAVLDVCLEYIIDVTDRSVNQITKVHTYMLPLSERLSVSLSENSALPSKYGPDPNSLEYLLVLWNDEHHNWEDATSRIIAATGCTQEQANTMATSIDSVGRHILKRSTTPSVLIGPQIEVESTGLVSTIVSSRDYCRSEIASVVVDWVAALVSAHDLSIQHAARQALCRSLVQPFEFETNPAQAALGDILLDDLGVTVANRIPASHPMVQSRVQFLMYYDIRYWKSMRKRTHDVLVLVLASDLAYKPIFCAQFVEVYGVLCGLRATADREWHLNLLSDVSTQLFTCPTTASGIVANTVLAVSPETPTEVSLTVSPSGSAAAISSLRVSSPGVASTESGADTEGSFPSIVNAITALFQTESVKRNGSFKFAGDSAKSVALKETLTRGLNDIIYVVQSCTNPLEILKPQNLSLLLSLVSVFQGSWAITRKYGDHVLLEDDSFVMHFEYCAYIYTIIRHIATGVTVDSLSRPVIQAAIKEIAAMVTPGATHTVDDITVCEFDVSKDPTSLMNPLNSFLASLLQRVRATLPSKQLLMVSDLSLRAVVLTSQIRIGSWVRNGHYVSRQGELYSGTFMVEAGYSRDVYLNQLAALTVPTKQFLYNVLDRWQLLKWFTGREALEATVYEDRIFYAVEEFIRFVYMLLTSRQDFLEANEEVKARAKIREVVSYCLVQGPRTFSDLCNDVPSTAVEDNSFEEVLEEVADYNPPSGFSDTGMYRLKATGFSALDPMCSSVDHNDYPEVYAALVSQAAKVKLIKEGEVVLVPVVVPLPAESVHEREGTAATEGLAEEVLKAYGAAHLGDFTRSAEFAKLVYKLLQVAIDKEEELFLPELLHLVHAILIDTQEVEGGLPESFLDKPICNLLLTIVGSSMAANIVLKANFLLDYFLECNKEILESLVLAFGEEYIQTYKSTKVGLFETAEEKRRRMAKERQERIKAKFAKRQEQFLANQEVDEEEVENEDAESEESGVRFCILCQHPETSAELFGMPAWTSESGVFWQLPNSVACALKAYQAESAGECCVGFPLTSEGKANFKLHYTSTTCGHGMHYRCFKESVKSPWAFSQGFGCPLCRSFNNAFVPTFMMGEVAPLAVLAPSTNHYRTLIEGVDEGSGKAVALLLFAADLLQRITKPGTDRAALVVELASVIRESNMAERLAGRGGVLSSQQEYGLLLAHTISMHEISNRIDHKDSLEGLLLMKAKDRTHIQSLMQMQSLMSSLKTELGVGSVESYKAFWEGDAHSREPFADFCVLFFQTGESFGTLSRMTLTRAFTTTLYELVRRCTESTEQAEAVRVATLGMLEDHADALRFLVRGVEGEFPLDLLPHLAGALYHCLAPLYRTLIFFRDLIHPMDRTAARTFDERSREVGLPSVGELAFLIMRDDSFESSIFNTASAQAVELLKKGPLCLPYPARIELMPLPERLDTFINVTGEAKRLDYSLCLMCGVKVFVPDDRKAQITQYHLVKHLSKECTNLTAVFFTPVQNHVNVLVRTNGGVFPITIGSPYLNKHGETSRRGMHRGQTAWLNTKRYQELTKMWLNGELYAYLSRLLFSSTRARNIININGEDVTFNQELDSEDLESDDLFVEGDDDVFMLNEEEVDVEVDGTEEPDLDEFYSDLEIDTVD